MVITEGIKEWNEFIKKQLEDIKKQNKTQEQLKEGYKANYIYYLKEDKEFNYLNGDFERKNLSL